MADKTLMFEINRHAKNIDRNTKHFGPKLPSGDKKEEDLTLQEISYTQMIMGSLASMVWGVKNINRAERVKVLLNKPNIFELTKGINSKLNREYSLLKQLYNKDNSSVTIKSITSNTNRILDSINTLSKIILTNYKQNSVDGLDEFEDKVNNSINSVIKSNKELIENTDTDETNIDLSSVIASLKNINDSINNINDTINTNTTRLLTSLGLIASIDKDTSDIITNNIINTDNSITNNSVNNTNNTSNNINNIDNTSNNVVNNNVSNNTSNISNVSESIETNTDEIVGSVNGITISLEKQNKTYIQYINDLINNVIKCLNDNTNNIIESLDNDIIQLINNFKSIGNLENNLQQTNVNESSTISVQGGDAFEKLKDLIIHIQQTPFQKSDLVGIDSIIDLLRKLANNEVKELSETSRQNLLKFQKLLDDSTIKGSLKKIFDSIEFIAKDTNIQSNIGALSDIIDTIVKILEIDTTKINLSGLVTLVTITDSKHGYIGQLLKNLSEASKDIETNRTAFEDLHIFFNSIVSLAEIGFIKRRRIRNNIRFINKNIIDEIPIIVKKLNDVAKDNQEAAYTAINNLTSLFSAITEISGMKINDRIRLLINLKFIKEIYLKEIVDILKYFKNIINGDFTSVVQALDSIQKVFDMILKIGDISVLKIMKISYKTDAIIDIIEDSIESLMEIISHVRGTKNAAIKIEEINRVFTSLYGIYETTPGILSSVKESLKIQMLIENISMIADLIELTNGLQNIKTQRIFDKQLPQLIENTYLIFGEDNFSNVIRKLNDLNNAILFFDENLIVSINDTLTKINELPEIVQGKRSIKSLKIILNEFDETKKGSIGELLAYMPKTGYEVISEIGNQLKSFTDVITSFNTIDKDQIDNIKTLLRITKTIVSQFNTEDENTIAGILEKSNIETPEKINDIATSMKPFVDVITHFDTLTKEQISNIRSLLKVTKTIVSQFEKKDQTIAYYLDKTNVKTIETLNTIGVILKTLSANLADVKIINKDQQKNLTELIKVTNTIVAQFDSKNQDSISAHLKGIDKKDIEKLDTMITLIKKLSTLNKIKIVLNISSRAIKEFTKIANPLKTFIKKLASVKNKDIKKANKVIDTFIKIVIGGAAILLLGSLIIGLVKPANLVLFTVTLATFLTSLGLVFWAVNKGFKHTMKCARNAMIIVGMGAAIMLLGSWFTSRKFFAGALIFTVELGIFLTAIGLVFWLVSRGFKRTMKGARNAMYIVGAAALVLILGSIAHNWYDFGNALLFTIELGLFLLALGGVFYLITPLFKGTYRSMKRALKLVVMSSLIMIGAQLIYGLLDASKIFGFVLILAGFLLAIGLAFKLTHKLIRNALSSVLLLTIVTTIAAGVLFFIGYLTKQHPEMLLYALGFALALVAYLAIIGISFKFMKKLIPYIVIGAIVMTGIMLVTLIAIGVMYLMYAVCSQPGFFWTIIVGLLAMGIVFTVFGGLMFLLGNLIIDSYGIGGALLVVGAVALIGIMGVVALASLTMALMYWACHNENFFMTIIKGLITMGIVFAVFTGVIMALGAIMATGVGAIAFELGVAALVQLEGVIALAAVVIKKIAAAVKELKDVSVSKGDIKRMEDTVTGFANVVILIIDKMPWNPLKIAKLVAITEVMHKASNAISAIARGIKEFSDMKFASQFDSKGNPIKYISITSADFTKAVKRIEQVLTCVSNGLLAVAKKKPDLFDEGLFTKSKAYNAMKVATKMGDALTSIAKGLKDWAELRFVVEYDEKGNPKKWASLTNGDLTQVATNIKTILTALGDAIIETAKGNERIFGSRWYDGILGNDTPAMNAVKCIKILGDVLNETASVVFGYSEGLLPVYDKDGHVLPKDQWQKLDLADLEKKKGSRLYGTIKTILCSLGDSISAVVEDPEVKDLFDTSFWNRVFGGGEGVNVATAIRDMAMGLNQTLEVITKLQTMQLDTSAPEKLKQFKGVIRDTIKGIIEIFKEFEKEDAEIAKIAPPREVTMSDNFWQGLENKGTKARGFIQNNTIGLLSNKYKYNTKEHLNYTKANAAQAVKDHHEAASFTSTKLNEILDAFNSLVHTLTSFSKEFEENKKYIDNFKNIDFNSCIKQIIEKLRSVESIDISNLNLEKTAETINKIDGAVNSIIGGIISLIKKYSDESKMLTNYDAVDMTEIVNKFLRNVSEIKNITIDDIGGLETNQFKTTQEKIDSVIALYTNTIDKIINLMNYAKNNKPENYNILKDGIFSIFTATENIDKDLKFSKYVDDLERFINTINTVKLSNLNEFKNFINSMNGLTSELTNMDSLTDAISNKLSMVLYELVLQLRKAEATIENAHTLQEKRKKLMDESISKIENIMGQHMIVEITQNNGKTGTRSGQGSGSGSASGSGSGSASGSGSGSASGSDSGSASGSGSGSTGDKSYYTVGNPEAEGAARGTDNSHVDLLKDYPQLKDVLTYNKFKDYMEKQFLEKMRNSG